MTNGFRRHSRVLYPSHHACCTQGWYVGGCLLQIFIAWGMLVHGVAGANARGPGIGKLYSFLAVYLVILWFGYPIVWGLAEGGNAISSTAEVPSCSARVRYTGRFITLHCVVSPCAAVEGRLW